mgnify:CR=1 FL=1
MRPMLLYVHKCKATSTLQTQMKFTLETRKLLHLSVWVQIEVFLAAHFILILKDLKFKAKLHFLHLECFSRDSPKSLEMGISIQSSNFKSRLRVLVVFGVVLKHQQQHFMEKTIQCTEQVHGIGYASSRCLCHV